MLKKMLLVAGLVFAVGLAQADQSPDALFPVSPLEHPAVPTQNNFVSPQDQSPDALFPVSPLEHPAVKDNTKALR